MGFLPMHQHLADHRGGNSVGGWSTTAWTRRHAGAETVVGFPMPIISVAHPALAAIGERKVNNLIDSC